MYHNNKLSLTTGKLPYKLTNDYLFRAVFQARPKALEGLCRSILHLSPSDTISVTLKNPIKLGEAIEDKEFILDLAVVINNSRFLNLEMQAYHDPDWINRSISYTARSFDNLYRGQEYNQVLPVTHVGFLDYTLFPEHPEFFATYLLTNPKTKQIYSRNFTISVVDLTQIELTTEEDKQNDIDLWARVFTATTWEEINMLAQNNEYLQEVVSGVAQLSAEEQIRQRCEAREYFYARERHINSRMEELEQQVATLSEKAAALAVFADKEIERIRKKIEAGKSLEQIAAELEDDVENLRPLYDEIIAEKL